MIDIKLSEIAYARSGDKGSHANVGVIAYTPEGYQFLQKNLTEAKVKKYFAHLGVNRTIRYELANLLALNFVLEEVLQGGASDSLRLDPQGKMLGQKLLNLSIKIDENLLKKCRPKGDHG